MYLDLTASVTGLLLAHNLACFWLTSWLANGSQVGLPMACKLACQWLASWPTNGLQAGSPPSFMLAYLYLSRDSQVLIHIDYCIILFLVMSYSCILQIIYLDVHLLISTVQAILCVCPFVWHFICIDRLLVACYTTVSFSTMFNIAYNRALPYLTHYV